MVGAGGDDRLEASAGQLGTPWMAVIAALGEQADGPLTEASGRAGPADGDRVSRGFSKRVAFAGEIRGRDYWRG